MPHLTYEDEWQLYQALHTAELMLIDDLAEHSVALGGYLDAAEKLLPNGGRKDAKPKSYLAEPDENGALRAAIKDLRDQCPLRIRSLLIHEHLRSALRGIIILDLIESPPESGKPTLRVVDK